MQPARKVESEWEIVKPPSPIEPEEEPPTLIDRISSIADSPAGAIVSDFMGIANPVTAPFAAASLVKHVRNYNAPSKDDLQDEKIRDLEEQLKKVREEKEDLKRRLEVVEKKLTEKKKQPTKPPPKLVENDPLKDIFNYLLKP